MMLAPSRLFPIFAGLFFLLCANLAAQRPQVREGFWISFGVGAGNLSWDCDGCTKADANGPTGFLRLGGTPSAKVLLGAEFNGWALDVGAADVTAGYGAFTVYWYPSATGGFFLKGGLGGASWQKKDAITTVGSSSGAVLLGTGYDWRVGRKISISPMLTLWSSTKADLRDNADVTVDTGFRHSGANLQVGITFH